MSCAICETRKEKRFCLALGGRICPQCCGEQREIVLDCPSQCPYLQQARKHEGAVGIDHLKRAELFLEVEIEDEFLYEHQQLVEGLMYGLYGRAARQDVRDRDLIEVLASLVKNQQTMVNSGLYYQAPTANIAQQEIADGLRAMVKKFQETEHQHRGYTSLREADILKAWVLLLRLAHAHTSGRPKSRAFIDFLRQHFLDETSPLVRPEEAGTRIVAP